MKNLLFALFAFGLLVGWTSCSKDAAIETADPDGKYDFSSSFAGEADGGSTGEEIGSGGNAHPGQLTAGEWNDLDNWDYWLDLLDKDSYQEELDKWQIVTSNRFAVRLTNTQQKPVIDAVVSLQGNLTTVWTARTDNFGRAELWDGFFGMPELLASWQVKIEVQGQSFSFDVHDYSQGENHFQLPIGETNPTTVDIAMVVDATSSMSDELEYIKNELQNVIERAEAGLENYDFRLGSVFYRDVTDEYITKVSAFTTNISQATAFIGEQKAQGGGDYPEAVHSALEKATQELIWSSDARTRLLFLILDAPPHEEANVVNALHNHITAAAEMGIKIIPITASGIDTNTEFLMRAMALTTNGTYTFITDHSGIGDDHLEPTVGEYEVEFLNDLMVRLIQKYVE